MIHARYAVDPARPWLGISPLGWARATGTLAANIEQRLAEETGGAVAHVLPVPQGPDNGEDDPLGDIRRDIPAARSKTVLVETTSAGWGEGKMAAPSADWQSKRIGANSPALLPTLRRDVFEAVLGACGVPVSLFTDADGTSQRESFRRFLTTAVMPLAEQVGDELSVKLERPIRFRSEGLYAHDLAGERRPSGSWSTVESKSTVPYKSPDYENCSRHHFDRLVSLTGDHVEARLCSDVIQRVS